jgi:2-dehydro-3-deoxyphosphooctonate aldolase (KDO 8-P synthase)
VAVGADGIFMEVHINPTEALCDGENTVSLDDLPRYLKTLKDIEGAL